MKYPIEDLIQFRSKAGCVYASTQKKSHQIWDNIRAAHLTKEEKRILVTEWSHIITGEDSRKNGKTKLDKECNKIIEKWKGLK